VEPVPDLRHPNSPLVEVVFEIRFPGDTAIECRRHEIQALVRDSYPKLWVPKVESGMALALEPYRFEKDDASAGIMVSLNRFGYFARAYPGFEAFRQECLRLIELFCSIVPVGKLTRVGLRHVNIIPFVRTNGLLPLEDVFVLGQEVERLFPGRFENFSTAFVSPVDGGKITTRIDSIIRMDQGQEALILDFDYAKEVTPSQELHASEIEQYLDVAHDESARLFHMLITSSYRDYIKGEEV